jgi:hypothetical protein
MSNHGVCATEVRTSSNVSGAGKTSTQLGSREVITMVDQG